MNNGNGIEFSDLLNIMSIYIGLKNLDLNQQQVDDVMKEMRSNQNSMLNTIIDQNKIIIKQDREIIELLKSLKGVK